MTKTFHVFLSVTIILIFTVVSCSGAISIQDIKLHIRVGDADSATIDSGLIRHYNDCCKIAVAREKKQIQSILNLIQQFQHKKLDTIVLTIGLIDNDSLTDTIQTRAFCMRDTVWVISKWVKNHKTIWSHQLHNPYMWINNDSLFDPEKRSIWVRFYSAIESVPSLETFSGYHNLLEMSINTGVLDLKNNGEIQVSPSDYKRYLDNYNGSLLEWGEIENRSGLYLWYEPENRFVLYYHD